MQLRVTVLTFSTQFIQRLIVNTGNRLRPKILTLDKKKAEKMRSYNYAEICGEYMRIFGYLYAILKMPLYAEKYAICGFWQKPASLV